MAGLSHCLWMNKIPGKAAGQGKGKGKGRKLEQDRQDTQKNKGDWSGVNQSPCFPYCYRETSVSTRGVFSKGLGAFWHKPNPK
jgi:hypothetical protein